MFLLIIQTQRENTPNFYLQIWMRLVVLKNTWFYKIKAILVIPSFIKENDGYHGVSYKHKCVLKTINQFHNELVNDSK